MMDDETQIRWGAVPNTDLVYPISDVFYQSNDGEDGQRPAENDLASLIDRLPSVWMIQTRPEPRSLADCLEAIPEQWVISETDNQNQTAEPSLPASQKYTETTESHELPLRHSDPHLVDFSASDQTSSNGPHSAGLTHTETLGIARADVPIELSVLSMAQNASAAPRSKLPNLLSDGVTASAFQAAALSADTHLTVAGARIVVADSLANLKVIPGWTDAASSYQVVDTLAEILAHIDTPLLSNASVVRPVGAAQINAITASVLAHLPYFDHRTASLVVADSASNIAEQASDVGSVATRVEINSSAAVSARQAESLVALTTSGKLAFVNDSVLVVRDTLANLVSEPNATGVALAAQIEVLDTAANLIAASDRDWSGARVSYTLCEEDTGTRTQALTSPAPGGRFSTTGRTLILGESAPKVIAYASTVAALGSKTKTIDTIGRIDANSASLVAMLGSLQWVDVIDRALVTSASAPALQRLTPKLGHVASVEDTAARINTLTVVKDLGAHVDVQAPDGAANIAFTARTAGPGSPSSIPLHDTGPVPAENAKGVVSVAGSIPLGAIFDVSEAAEPVASYAALLQQLGDKLGTPILPATTATAAVMADALAPLSSHLNTGLMLLVTDSTTEIATNFASLESLQLDDKPPHGAVANETVSNVLANQAALAAIGAQVSISDSAANVVRALDQLEALCGPGGIVQSIGLTDQGMSTLTVSVAQLGQDSDVLPKITTPHRVEVADSAANIQFDLFSGNSVLVANNAEIASIDAAGGIVALFQDQAIASAAVLAKLIDGMLIVIGVDVSHLSAVFAAKPTNIYVVDSAADVQADLTSGNSELMANNAEIIGIDVGGGTVTVNQDQAIASAAVLFKLTGGNIVVSGVDVTHLSEVASLGLPQISIMDTAAAIQADLISGNSVLMANNAEITRIDAGGGTVTVNQDQAIPSAAVLFKLTDGNIVVSRVDVAHLSEIVSLGLPQISIDIADNAAAIQADLASGNSVLVANNGEIASIDAENGTITVNQAQAFASAGILTKLTDGSVIVSGVDIDHLSEVASLGLTRVSIDVADTAADIQADLTSDNSVLVTNSGQIASVIADDGGSVSLTQAEILSVGIDDGAGSVLSKLAGDTLVVTGADVAHINTVLGLSVAPANITVSDTAAHLQADLASSSSALLANGGNISSIDAEGGTIALTQDQVLAENFASVLPKLIDDDIVVTGVDLAHVAYVTSLDLPRTSIVVVDTVANLLNPANAEAEALATTLKLAGPDIAGAIGGEALLSNKEFALDQTLTISDTAGNLLDGVLAEDINASPYKSYVEVTLSDPETLDAHTAQELVSLNGFADPLHRLTIADSSSHLLDPASDQAEIDASSVTLTDDETVSLEVVKNLAAVPHFSLGESVLHLASNDYADAATLKAIADFGSGFDPNSHTVTMTQDATVLTASEYRNLQSDDVVQNNHVLSWLPTGVTAGGNRGTATISGSGEAGGTVNVCDSSGSLLSSSGSNTAAFTASGTDGHAVVLTESVSGWSDSAPIIVLEQSVILNAVAAAGATLASAGAVQIGGSVTYLDLYNSGSVPGSLSNPALVYDAAHHTLSLDIPGYATTVLVTLNVNASPTHLDASEIFIKHYTT
jgi:hypothetical protein